MAWPLAPLQLSPLAWRRRSVSLLPSPQVATVAVVVALVATAVLIRVMVVTVALIRVMAAMAALIRVMAAMVALIRVMALIRETATARLAPPVRPIPMTAVTRMKVESRVMATVQRAPQVPLEQRVRPGRLAPQGLPGRLAPLAPQVPTDHHEADIHHDGGPPGGPFACGRRIDAWGLLRT
ncbi:hypothetical protein [Cobetia sp. UCD-24C]|uniref:hypothetical protein n=1 Tax=Cobetia sp. UCD-24C TaxID=1716176 RepID=UPI001364AC5D|nr:hypothetical protein [Cobetia sp. UCD-24C]